jgi:hypothetical protein
MVANAGMQLQVAAATGNLGACITSGTITGMHGTWVTIDPELTTAGDIATFEVRMGVYRGTVRITTDVAGAGTITLQGGLTPLTITAPYDPATMKSWWFLPDETGSDHVIEVWHSADATTWTHATTWHYGGLSLFSLIILLQGETTSVNSHHVVSFDDFNEPCN